jgi:L-malate glycosyltransferase
VRVLLVGDGAERAHLDALARSLGVSGRLRMTGKTADVTAYLAAADVAAVPSRNEGMGRVIVEAMALGLPVVATAVGGIPDVVTDGECGRLVEPESPDALAAALIELGRDPGLRRKLGEAAEQRAEAFSTSVASEKLLAVYAALVRDKGLR